jgi:uncharacterized protein (DUF342 family)
LTGLVTVAELSGHNAPVIHNETFLSIMWINSKTMQFSTISVTYSPDGMKSLLSVANGADGGYPNENDLSTALRAHGVVFGIDSAVIRAMVVQRVFNTNVEVARGLLPIPGVPGKNEILIDISNKGKPRKLADGRVDYHDISYVVNVKKETPLVKHTPPIPGQPGRTVFDKPIDPPPIPDKSFVAGKGTKIAPDDKNVLIADINGDVIIHSNGKIDVVDKKTITGNVDYSTGNIKFSGDLEITGTVRAGFEVEAEGHCLIGGNVEDAKISCRQDIEIIGGAIGASKACLNCGGSLKVKHIANFDVQAGDDIHVLEDTLHCTLSADGNISAKSIVGGTISAWKIIEAETIGTEAEPKTIVDLGGRFVCMQKKDALLKKLAGFIKEIGSLKEDIFLLVRNEMDGDGNLHEGSLTRLNAMKESHRQRKEKYLQVQNDIETVDDKLKNRPVPFLKARTVFPNTIIKFGTFEELIREKLYHARITVDMEKIIIGKYEV